MKIYRWLFLSVLLFIGNISAYSLDEYDFPTFGTVDKTGSAAPGFIPINSDWTPTGAKTYMVPINVPSGINQLMTPQLALCYNSQQNSGIAGIGWSISGLSSIMRIGKSIYYDNTIDGINLDSKDAFILDGSRLIKLRGDDSSIFYQTEQGNVRVTAHLTSGKITHFEAFYPSGTKAEYGFAVNLDEVCFPMVKSLDPWGNSMDYEYNKTEGSYLISGIRYNSINSVTFDYSSPLEQYTETIYAGGVKIVSDRYLCSIECKINADTYCRYELTHSNVGRYSVLTRIDYYCGDMHFNPLSFSYGDGKQTLWGESKTNIQHYLTSPQNSGLRFVRGKFDYGTGNDGFVTFNNKIGYWKEQMSSHTEQFTNKYAADEKIIIYSGLDGNLAPSLDTIVTGKGFIDVVCADITGTQREDIIRINNYVENNHDYLYFYVYIQEDSETCLKQRTARRFEFVPEIGNNSSESVKFRPKDYRVGDFNGDGKMELLVTASNESSYKSTEGTKCYVLDVDEYIIRYDGYGFEYIADRIGTSQSSQLIAENNSDKLFVVDINGDGKHEICHITSTATDFYEFNTSGDAWPINKKYSFTGLDKWDLVNRSIIPCDLNGDGLTDLVISPVNDNKGNEWTVYYSKGDGSFDRSSFFASKNNSTVADNGYFFQDINGDGKADLIVYSTDAFWTYESGPYNFIPGKKPSVSHQVKYPTEYKIPPVLIPIDVSSRNKYSKLLVVKNGTVIKYSPVNNRMRALCTVMNNGLGLIEHNYYSFANDPESDVCTKGSGAKYPYMNLYEGLIVLSESRSYLDSEMLSKNSYHYENPILHRQGLGFLG
ncbi:MAG: FG-GAP-like repeat-containing protein, partial [Muribaculum sp.]|nr:FG-GAP-like repeat-containing protein [Muribaculum sp.]